MRLSPLDGPALAGRPTLEVEDGCVGGEAEEVGDVPGRALGGHALGATVDGDAECLQLGVQGGV